MSTCSLCYSLPTRFVAGVGYCDDHSTVVPDAMPALRAETEASRASQPLDLGQDTAGPIESVAWDLAIRIVNAAADLDRAVVEFVALSDVVWSAFHKTDVAAESATSREARR